jgi:hypothetical protein
MLCKVTFVIRLLVAKKLDEIIEGRIFFVILIFFIEFHHLELSTPTTTPTSCILSHVQEIHVFSKMYHYIGIVHKAVIFPMGNIFSIDINWIVLTNNTLYDLRIKNNNLFTIMLTTKNP